MRGAKNAPRDLLHVLERIHGLAEIVERGGGVSVDRLPVKAPTDEGVPSGLAYTQVQLALTSLIIGGTWALVTDWTPITTKGLWYGFDYKACIAAVNSAAGGLTVAAVLKYADAVLKGYATAISVLLTGVLSMVLFGTELSVEYALGMTNVLAAVFLYNAQDLEKHAW